MLRYRQFNLRDGRPRYRSSFNDDAENERPIIFTDVRFETANLPSYTAHKFDGDEAHPHEPHRHESLPESFNWCSINDEDDVDVKAKKKLIQPVCDQGMCGSCWAVCTANVISDCLVVSGAVNWSPRISSTFLMMALPKQDDIQQMCNGGNPARVVKLLERFPVVDESCVDYSWCTRDQDKLCLTKTSANHFGAKITDVLNEKIPTKIGCYEPGNKFVYSIDSGSNIYHVDLARNVDEFRNVVRSHIVDFGPTIAGFVVLRNFTNGAHTVSTSRTGGVYFDRAVYGRGDVPITFSDAETTKYKGLHAVSVVGWGVAKGVMYDNNKYGDVPYWVCRNSWGPEWGKQGGLFKIACYPYNKIAQLDKIVDLPNYARIGSMILVRACNYPSVKRFKKLDDDFTSSHTRIEREDFYRLNPDEILTKTKSYFDENRRLIIVATLIVASLLLLSLVVWQWSSIAGYAIKILSTRTK